jgi:hypothetical protein
MIPDGHRFKVYCAYDCFTSAAVDNSAELSGGEPNLPRRINLAAFPRSSYRQRDWSSGWLLQHPGPWLPRCFEGSLRGRTKAWSKDHLASNSIFSEC